LTFSYQGPDATILPVGPVVRANRLPVRLLARSPANKDRGRRYHQDLDVCPSISFTLIAGDLSILGLGKVQS